MKETITYNSEETDYSFLQALRSYVILNYYEPSIKIVLYHAAS